MEQKSEKQLDQISAYAAFLAVIEVGLGSVVHALKLPFAGTTLSVNQGLVLTHAAGKIKTNIASSLMMISSLVAILKSLSPAGNKLGPMVSICAQGFLYSIGIFLFGFNPVGIVIGMCLLSLWAFVQPFITLYIFFGHHLTEAFQFYLIKMAEKFSITGESLLIGVMVIVGIKCVVASILGIVVYYRPGPTEKYMSRIPMRSGILKRLRERDQEASTGQVALLALKDMTKPFFLFSFVLMILFFVFSRSEWSEAIWLSLRPLAIAFLFFFLARHPSFYKRMSKLRRFHFFDRLFLAMDKTVLKIEEMHK